MDCNLLKMPVIQTQLLLKQESLHVCLTLLSCSNKVRHISQFGKKKMTWAIMVLEQHYVSFCQVFFLISMWIVCQQKQYGNVAVWHLPLQLQQEAPIQGFKITIHLFCITEMKILPVKGHLRGNQWLLVTDPLIVSLPFILPCVRPQVSWLVPAVSLDLQLSGFLPLNANKYDPSTCTVACMYVLPHGARHDVRVYKYRVVKDLNPPRHDRSEASVSLLH